MFKMLVKSKLFIFLTGLRVFYFDCFRKDFKNINRKEQNGNVISLLCDKSETNHPGL